MALPFSTLVDSALPWLANIDLVNLLVESISTSGPLADSDSAGVLSNWSSSTVCRISDLVGVLSDWSSSTIYRISGSA